MMGNRPHDQDEQFVVFCHLMRTIKSPYINLGNELLYWIFDNKKKTKNEKD